MFPLYSSYRVSTIRLTLCIGSDSSKRVMPSPVIVDFHAHVFSPALPRFLPPSSRDRLAGLRRRARDWARPLTSALHQTHSFIRHLPEPARRPLDQLSGLAPLPGLLLEST